MKANQELRRNWRKNWLSCIQEFADDEMQHRMWLDPSNTNPHFSFVECFCAYFDDLDLSNDGYTTALNEGLVNGDEVAAVSGFHQNADKYESPTDNYDHRAILADPLWTEVVAAAQRAQTLLVDLIDDPHERSILMKP
jgi:hypothetical protein